MVKKSFPLLLALLLCSSSLSANADQYVEYGIQMLKAKNYKSADKYFDQRLKLVPKDEKTHYYKALCAHYSGDKAKARELYNYVINTFPGTAMATNATNSIKKMDEAEEKARIAAEEAAKKAEADAAAKNPGAKPTAAKVPDPAKPGAKAEPGKPAHIAALPTHLPVQGEARVHFDKIENDTVFSAIIDGKQKLVNFDTAADKNWMPRPQFAEFGLTGNGPEWKLKVQVGSITKIVAFGAGADWEPRPKLGMPFLDGLDYTMDTAGSTIIFRSGGGEKAAVAGDLYTVPFTRRGQDLLVDVGMKGKKTVMKINTSSDEIIVTKKNFDQLDMQIPIFSKRQGERWSFAVDELFLGKLRVDEPYVTAILPEDGSEGAPEGTFGLRVFTQWKYTIDNKNNCLRFFH